MCKAVNKWWKLGYNGTQWFFSIYPAQCLNHVVLCTSFDSWCTKAKWSSLISAGSRIHQDSGFKQDWLKGIRVCHCFHDTDLWAACAVWYSSWEGRNTADTSCDSWADSCGSWSQAGAAVPAVTSSQWPGGDPGSWPAAVPRDIQSGQDSHWSLEAVLLADK